MQPTTRGSFLVVDMQFPNKAGLFLCVLGRVLEELIPGIWPDNPIFFEAISFLKLFGCFVAEGAKLAVITFPRGA